MTTTTTGKMRRSFSLASSSFSSLMRNKNTANDLVFNLVPSTAFISLSRRSLCDDYDGILAPFTRQFTSSSSSKNSSGGHGFQLGELFAASGRRRRSKRDALFVDWKNSSTSKTSSARFVHASSSSVLFSNKATESESYSPKKRTSTWNCSGKSSNNGRTTRSRKTWSAIIQTAF